jgi:hypothetical protein
MRRNKSTFQWGATCVCVFASVRESTLDIVCCRQLRTKLQLFQMDWGIDKIARRGANRGNKRLFGLTYH